MRIGYQDYDLYFVKKIDGGSTQGECHYNDGAKGVIRIAKGQKKVEKANTILHELLHAISYTQGLHLSADMEERVVRAIANGLIDFMRTNPKVMNQILSLIKD